MDKQPSNRRGERHSFTMTPIESWSVEKRRNMKDLVFWMIQRNMDYQDLCGLSEEIIAHKTAPEMLLAAMKETDIDELKEEEVSVHIMQDPDNSISNNFDMVTTEQIEEEEESNDFQFMDDINKDLLENNHPELEVNDDNKVIIKKTSSNDLSIVQQQLNDDQSIDDHEKDKKEDDIEQKQLIEYTILKEHILFNEMEAFSPYPEASRSSVPMVQDEETKQESIPSHASSVPITSNLSGNAAVNSSSNKSKLNRDAPIFTPQQQTPLPPASSMLSAASNMLQASLRVNNEFIVTNYKPNINGDEQNNDIQSTPNNNHRQNHHEYQTKHNFPQSVYKQPQQIKKQKNNDNDNNPQIFTADRVHKKSSALKPNHCDDAHIEEDEQKYYHDMKSTSNKPMICRQWTSSQPQGLHFQPKYRNHAKGNFYVSEITKWKIAATAKERFFTIDANQNNVALLLYYVKESSAMQINDGQVRVVYGHDGKARVIIDIDLHFRDGQKMYLIAERQKKEDREEHGVEWQIVEMMTAEQLSDIGINSLPQSSRDRNWYKKTLSYSPRNMTKAEIVDMLNRTNFRSKRFRKNKDDDDQSWDMQIPQKLLKKCCKDALYYNNSLPLLPVVVIKNDKHWIEWKQIVGVYDVDDHANTGRIAISLRYYEKNQRWNVEMIDDDGGVVYYKHRLVSYEYSYPYDQIQSLKRLNIL